MTYEEFENGVIENAGNGKAVISIQPNTNSDKSVQVSISYDEGFIHTTYHRGEHRYQDCLMDLKLQIFNAQKEAANTDAWRAENREVAA